MTNWLKWRLCALFGTTLLISGATYLHAQNGYPAPAATPEEAGARFFELLSTRDDLYGRLSGAGLNGEIYGLISRPQMESIESSSQNSGQSDKLQQLLALLAQERDASQLEARVANTNGNKTVVEVSPSAQPKNREVVVVAEDGGYRVDLKATFARWNNLSGAQLDKEWYSYTSIASPALLQDGNFLRSQCQTQMKQQMLGILQYAQDYDEKYPPARSWIDAVQPYVKSEQIFKCPAMPKNGNGYAYNQYFSQRSIADIDEVARTVNVYETSNPKRNWFGRGTGRAFRHMGGWNLAFADGHIKWFKEGSGQGSVTFLPNPRMQALAKNPNGSRVALSELPTSQSR